MSNRFSARVLLVCSLLLAGGSFVFLSAGEKTANKLGQPIADFSLPDSQGQTVSLSAFQKEKAVVVVFLGTECPINNAYAPRLAELSKQYAGKGVQFLAINANQQDTPARIAEHAKQHGLPFPVLKDAGNKVADQFAAQRTPEAFVLDAQHRVRYQGRIDDQYGIGYQRAKPNRRDLAVALDEVLAGTPVSQPRTEVPGCLIARVVQPKTEGTVTYSKQVARLVQQHCQECHRPGQVGPMALLSYEDALAWSDTIREVLQQERMPPWYADPRYGHFTNDRRLPAEDKATLLAWLDQGMPKGDDKDLPPLRTFAKGWAIGQPDVILTMEEEFDVPADTPRGGVPYQHFRVKTNFKEDKWVVRAEAKPGQPSVVHHIVVYVVPPGEEFNPGNPNTPLLVGTAPGEMPSILPTGYAKKVPAGSDLIFQMHYTPNGTAQKDRSYIGLMFAKKAPKYEVHTIPIANEKFLIPAGARNFKVEQWLPFQQEGELLSFMPHMHLRGKDFLYELTPPGGKPETLLSVPRYNFNWQSYYRLEKPIHLTPGCVIHCVAHFDNSSKNPNNPDPAVKVSWGDQTWEEMMIGWIDYADKRATR